MSEVTETVEETTEEKSEASEPREARAPKSVAKLEEEGDIAADYLEGLLDIADLRTQLRAIRFLGFAASDRWLSAKIP